MKNAAAPQAETSAQALRGLVEDAKKMRAQMGPAAYDEYFAFEKCMARLRSMGQQESK